MFRKLRRRVQRSVAERLRFDFEGLELDLSTRDVIADLVYGADRYVATAPQTETRRPPGSRA
jgi:hypothetical protein